MGQLQCCSPYITLDDTIPKAVRYYPRKARVQEEFPEHVTLLLYRDNPDASKLVLRLRRDFEGFADIISKVDKKWLTITAVD